MYLNPILAQIVQHDTFITEQVVCLTYRHGVEMNKLMNEMESQKELLLTYEQTLTHKDSIVANITDAIQKQVRGNL